MMTQYEAVIRATCATDSWIEGSSDGEDGDGALEFLPEEDDVLEFTPEGE